MSLDKITEAIAHFIGLFNTATEEARARDSYHEFRFWRAEQDDLPIFQPSSIVVRAPYELEDFTPALRHTPLPPAIVPAFSGSVVSRTDFDVQVPAWHTWSLFGVYGPTAPLARPSLFFHERDGAPTIEPPGSVAVIVQQRLHMSDDDRISFGDHGLHLAPDGTAAARVAALVDDAARLLPLAAPELPGSPAEIKDFILSAADELGAFAPDGPESGAQVSVVKGSALSGIYVNGMLVDELPDYEAYRPPEPEEDEDEDGIDSVVLGGPHGGEAPSIHEAVPTSASGQDAYRPLSGVELTAGDNLLVNSVSIGNVWLAAAVTAVGGDYVELNAILQANVWSDADVLTGVFGRAADDAETIGFNIASFVRVDPQGEGTTAAPHGDFPSFWAVTQVTGDLLIANWIEQLSFMSDNDVAVLSAGGGFAKIVGGDNTQLNGVSLAELGRYYDLIVVGGSVFDANIIHQINVLLDDDVIGALAGFSAAGGSVSTHGNLLWNEAAITNVGAADRFSSLPDVFRDAIEGLSAGAGSGRAPSDLLQHSAFAGLEALRVLYITGDMINLQFVKQTNILGDGDHVALAMNAAAARPDSQWALATGANTLVNAASIHDVDAFGATHVGGQVYSDEILIQAELIAPSAFGQNFGRGADALVSEAIAFLSDDPDGHGAFDGIADAAPMKFLPLATAQADPMNVLHA